ncbi:hypothetical protein RvY_11968 [Ramazzottius varieornatus]|uniref:Ankyrin repeat domain-containing protein n=1 Tax=Ramazzottius varieornatus TaxID=947166 RepID=A0A1D1VKA3_RAMVA|nr:hypothetical protein RvY_11968 [Ramazzottius varieornatus]
MAEPLPAEGRSNSSTSLGRVEKKYPLHLAVWKNDVAGLRKLCSSPVDKEMLEKKDPRGRTPLMLAVCLDHFECAQILLESGATCENSVRTADGWAAVHEATCTGDVELLSLILQYRDSARSSLTRDLDTVILSRLREVPDFYVEMKWEFSSWIPFVSRLCPSDVCRIYKKGACVRLDTTLVGFENNAWTRGSRSLLFVENNGEMAFHEVDHDAKVVRTEKAAAKSNREPSDIHSSIPSDATLQQRMRTPVMLTTIDAQNIKFERSKSGFLWRADKVEQIGGHECKVFHASNVTFVTRIRSEHLTENDKKQLRDELSRNPLNGLLSSARGGSTATTEENGPSADEVVIHEDAAFNNGAANLEEQKTFNPSTIKCEEYFSRSVDLGDREIGRPKQLSKRQRTFKANLWLCDDYPLSLKGQVMPIIDMMASTNAHFKKLQDFITLQLPSGFPVKIEIPLFHVLTARITFENIYGSFTPVDGVMSTPASEDGSVPAGCTVDESVFNIPPDYEQGAAWWQDDLNIDLQETDLDLVELQADLEHIPNSASNGNLSEHGDHLIQKAVQLSVQEENDKRRAQEEAEQKDLEEALRRSLEEK